MVARTWTLWTGLVALGAAGPAGAQQETLTASLPDGSEAVVLVGVPAEGDALVLHWGAADGPAVRFVGSAAAGWLGFAELTVPEGLEPDGTTVFTTSGGASFEVGIGELMVVATDDAPPRWVLGTLDRQFDFPAAPGSIQVGDGGPAPDPGEEPQPEPEPGADPEPPTSDPDEEPDLATRVMQLALRTLQGGEDAPAIDAQLLGALTSGEFGPDALRPDTLNPLLGDLLQSGHGFAFLADTDLRFKTFESDTDTALGLAFDYQKHVPFFHEQTGPSHVRGLGYRIDVQGNIAFDQATNPSDFMAARVSLDYFSSHGGTQGALAPEDQRRANDLAFSLAGLAQEDLFTSDAWAELSDLAKQVLDDQFAWQAGLVAGFESDQSFEARHLTVGVRGAFEFNAWNDDSLFAQANLFDYPAALLRQLTGRDQDWRPRGNAFPSVHFALEHVEPSGSTPRAALGEDQTYERLRVELAYKSPLGTMSGQDYWLVAGYHLLHELDAPATVDNAGLDRYDFLQVTVEAEDGVYLSFGSGRRPFDLGDDQFAELGWKFRF